jgi:deoxycytidine triphosphate deaminase
MGAFLKVELPIEIEKYARVAQMIVTETYPVDEENLYDGQWQGDKQRK